MFRAECKMFRSFRCRVAVFSAVISLLMPTPAVAAPDYHVIADTVADHDDCEIEVLTYRVSQDGSKTTSPVRVTVTGDDQTHYDGGGRGLYADGRFFAEGSFDVRVPPGIVSFHIRSGPNYRPVKFDLTAKSGRRMKVEALLHEWFAPERHGWYAGDNHVHAQHDREAVVKTSLSYAALQARATGLSYITEAPDWSHPCRHHGLESV